MGRLRRHSLTSVAFLTERFDSYRRKVKGFVVVAVVVVVGAAAAVDAAAATVVIAVVAVAVVVGAADVLTKKWMMEGVAGNEKMAVGRRTLLLVLVLVAGRDTDSDL